MSEFWVSNGRVFCEFCKCWYADNKVEKETHERGSKHQVAKAKALASIRKLSEWNAKEQDKIEGYLAEADRAAKEAYKRDLKEAGITANSARRQKRDEERQKQKELQEIKERAECKNWHQAKDQNGTLYYWHQTTRETRWKAPPYWEDEKQKEQEEFEKAKEEASGPNSTKEVQSEEGTTTHIIKTSKPSFKKKGGSLFKSSAGTNSRINNTTNAIAQKISVAKEQETFAGVDDANKGKKRSNDVAYGTWVPKKEVKKEEFDNDLGLPEFADAFFEKETNDKTNYKGFTYKDDRFQVGGEAKPPSKSLVNDDDDGDNPEKIIPFKKKKFGGNIRKKFD